MTHLLFPQAIMISFMYNNGCRYTNLLDANNYAYDYNPCKPFTTQGECANVHVSPFNSATDYVGV